MPASISMSVSKCSLASRIFVVWKEIIDDLIERDNCETAVFRIFSLTFTAGSLFVIRVGENSQWS